MPSSKPTQLKLIRPAFTRSLSALLDQLAKDRAGQARFAIDPAGVIVEAFPDLVGPQNAVRISEANRLVHSMLSNDRFRKWAIKQNAALMKRYNELGPDALDPIELRRRMAEAIVESGDPALVNALLGAQTRNDGLTTTDMQSRVDSVFVVEVVIAAIAVAVIHMVITAIDFTPFAPEEIEGRLQLKQVPAAELRAVADQIAAAAAAARSANQL